MNDNSWKWGRWTWCFLLPAMGCAFDATSSPGADGVADVPVEAPAGEVKQALCNSATRDDCCDATKYSNCYLQPGPVDADFKIKIYVCPEPAAAGKQRVLCGVEPGWTLIGGGAEITGLSLATNGSVMMDASFPNGDVRSPFAAWDVSTHEVWGSHPHSIITYVIGMKMKGYDNSTVDTLAPVKVLWDQPTTLKSRPHAEIGVPNGYLLLGGGFIMSTGPGQQVFPVDAYATAMRNGTWVVNGSDLGFNHPGFVNAISVSVDPCPAKWSSCFSDRAIKRLDSSSGTGVRAAIAINANDGFFPVGVGFISSSWNRPIFRVLPMPFQFFGGYGGAVGSWSPLLSPDEAGYVTAQAMTLHR